MSKYLSAEELKIPESFRDALIRMRDGFCKGEFKHVKRNSNYTFGSVRKGKKAFNMAIWEGKYSCGTVCCIGGWIDTISGNNTAAKLGQEDWNIRDLFAPGYQLSSITTLEAAAAINNYLATGKAHWDKIIAGRQK